MVNMSRLSNKVAIVTGAPKASALGLQRPWQPRRARGGELFLRPARRRTALSGDHRQRGRGDLGRADVSKAADVARLFDEVDSAFGRLDVLVNNAGVFRFGGVAEITEESFHLHYNINVLGTILAVQEAIKRFGADGGSIINLSSIVGSHPVAGACCTRPRKAPSKH